MTPSRPAAAPRISAALLALALATPAAVPAFADGPRDERRGIALFQDDDDSDDDVCTVVSDDEDGVGAPFCDNQIIVRFAAKSSPDDLGNGLHEEILGTIPERNTYLLEIPPDRLEADTIEEIEEDEDDVLWAELNYVGNAPQGNPSRFFPRGRDSGFEPAAATSGDSYGDEAIGADGLRCVNGKGVTVAVIDTGIDAGHPLFRDRIAKPWNAFTGLGSPAAVADTGDGANNDGDLDKDGNALIDEAVGHGTHVAGIVLQAAPRATVMPIKALDSDGSGQAFYLARAIGRATGAGADVINLSLGSEGESRAVREAVDAALRRRIVVVAAAGNAGGVDAASGQIVPATREFPAAQPGVIAVGAIDEAGSPAAFSSRYADVHLSAPGVDIVSAFPHGAQGVASNYAIWSGTSMAAPWVSAAAALMLDQRPKLTPAMVATRLENGAEAFDPALLMGAGRLDVGEAISCRKKGGKKRR